MHSGALVFSLSEKSLEEGLPEAQEATETSVEGCSITILSEGDDKAFIEELEEQGHVVRSRPWLPFFLSLPKTKT